MEYQREEIEAIVRQVVTRTMGGARSDGAKDSLPASRTILNADTVREMPPHSTYILEPGTLVTPLAREVALERRIELSVTSKQVVGEPPVTAGRHTVAIGADHGGYALKEQIKTMLTAEYQVIDCGTNSAEAVDYPDYAYAVAQLVANGRAWRGIMIDGAGIGSCMAANKVPGVRAAMCYDQATAVNSREHNNANILTLGAGLIGPQLASQIVTTWLNSEFGGGRHARRVEKIDAIGRRFAKIGNQ